MFCLFAWRHLAPTQITVNVETSRVLNTFRPDTAFGAGVDGKEKGEIDRIYTPHNVREMQSAGLASLSYRLRTELAVDAFHWNPVGVWSEGAKKQGYWTSSDVLGAPILKCNGYHLPRRGNTTDQANDDGYSRIDDGDRNSFWKSNPYLDRVYTNDPDWLHPQWIVIDLGEGHYLDTLKISWANPYAKALRIDYSDGPITPVMDEGSPGVWRTFPNGVIKHSVGGDQTITLGFVPQKIRFVRMMLRNSSYTSEDPKSTDRRDKMGFAVREIGLGKLENGRFTDYIVHRPDKSQSHIFTSSTDPWHREIDLDSQVEQPGFDRIFAGPLTNNRPILVPVPILYDTPENAAAEVRYLKRRGYSIRGFELGEEPDGQYITPEHFGALYHLFAKQIRKVDKDVHLGGPSFQSPEIDVLGWPDEERKKLWLQGFVDYLQGKRSLRNFQFLSFEWYPFDDMTQDVQSQLISAPTMLSTAFTRLKSVDYVRRIPWFITEYGYSAHAGPPEIDIPGAILNLDIVGKFLELGGTAAYLFGYEPTTPYESPSGLIGNLMMLQADESGAAKYKLPTYYAARLMTQEWCLPGSGIHKFLNSRILGSPDRDVCSYAVKRPDGRVSIILLNKNFQKTADANIRINGKAIKNYRITQYGRSQYQWKNAGIEGYPLKSLPPVSRVQSGSVQVPPQTICVITSN